MFFQVLALAKKAVKFHDSRNTTNASTAPTKRPGRFQLIAILPAIVVSIALLLAFLCVFAGHKPGMMEDYAVFTLNTSRIFQNTRQDLDGKIMGLHFKRDVELPAPTVTITTAPTTMITMAPRDLGSELDSLAGAASSGLQSAGSGAHGAVTSAESAIASHATSIESAVASHATSALASAETKIVQLVDKAFDGIIDELHIKDFYSIHMMTSCSGEYLTKDGQNITVGSSGAPENGTTHKHIDVCEANSAINPLSLTKIIYWAGIIFTALAVALGWTGILLKSRKIALFNVAATLPAFLFIGLGSAITHGIAVGAAKLVNFVGADIGIAGYAGGKFIALTWTTTVLLLLNLILWSLLFVQRGRQEKRAEAGLGSGLGFGKKSMRPDRTSQIALESVSRPQQVYDRNGNQMI